MSCDICEGPTDRGSETITDAIGGAFANLVKNAGVDPAEMPTQLHICKLCVEANNGRVDEELVLQAVRRIVARLNL